MPTKIDTKSSTLVKRSPVVAVMGHIDHGKSTLLDYIRKANVTSKEVGGITQHLGAYEVKHTGQDGKENKITFLDTPGHEAFSGIRSRGAGAADVAVLVVSGEEGVKPQTKEAFQAIRDAKVPFIVAINKIDSPKADIERTKQNLAENEIYLEGYGGDVPWVAISGKTGEGIPAFLDLITLLGDMSELGGNPGQNAEGVVIEANLDKREGVSAVLIVKNGTLKKGQVVVSGESYSVVRNIKDFAGNQIEEATFSSPVTMIGWSQMPKVGEAFVSFSSKKEALNQIESSKTRPVGNEFKQSKEDDKKDDSVVINLVIKADASGSLEAVVGEVGKIKKERVSIKIIHADVGGVNLNDIKKTEGLKNVFLIGFNVEADSQAKSYAERVGAEINTFDIIYKLMEWLEKEIQDRVPKINVEEALGRAKILKVFSRNRDKQIVGGRVEVGSIFVGEEVRILRRDAEIGKGKIKELQQQKEKASEAKKDTEFGAQIQCPIEIVPGDRVEGYKIVER